MEVLLMNCLNDRRHAEIAKEYFTQRSQRVRHAKNEESEARRDRKGVHAENAESEARKERRE